MPKEVRVNVRVSEALKKRVQKASEITKISETSFVVACLEALCDYYEANGEITMPLVVKPKSADKPRSKSPDPSNTGAIGAIRRASQNRKPENSEQP